jgi:hypothetical protein
VGLLLACGLAAGLVGLLLALWACWLAGLAGLLAGWPCRLCGLACLLLLLFFFFFNTSLHLKHNIKFRLYKIKMMHVNKFFLYNVMK